MGFFSLFVSGEALTQLLHRRLRPWARRSSRGLLATNLALSSQQGRWKQLAVFEECTSQSVANCVRSFLITLAANAAMFAGVLEMNNTWKEMLWQQFGAAIAMLSNAMLACPDELWSDRSKHPEFWYVAYHTLFWLDLYLSDSLAVFVPPHPFTLDELDPAGIIPEEPYTKEQLQNYLVHGRNKCRVTIAALSEESTRQRCGFKWLDITVAELMLYNLRHVQHHVAQLNLLLRQNIGSAPHWVAQAKEQPET